MREHKMAVVLQTRELVKLVNCNILYIYMHISLRLSAWMSANMNRTKEYIEPTPNCTSIPSLDNVSGYV